MKRRTNQRYVSLLAVLGLLGAACSTAGAQLESNGAIEGLPFESPEQTEQPVTETEPEEDITAEETSAAIVDFDPSVAGPDFDIATPGPTLTVAGESGVWWFDANGEAHLVVEPAVASDYDGSGGLVFQRSPSSPIVRRTAEAAENDVAAPGEGERLRLIGVATVGGANEAIYLRLNDAAATANLERATLDTGLSSSIAEMARDGFAPERMSISGGYVSGVYLGGSGSGWVTVSLSSGGKLFGTADGETGKCPAAGCAEAVTVSADGTTVFQVAATGSGSLDLVLNSASDFSELARVDLERPDGGWHPTRVESIGGQVIVSRSANADGTGDLPALVVEPSSGSVAQMGRNGQAVIVTG